VRSRFPEATIRSDNQYVFKNFTNLEERSFSCSEEPFSDPSPEGDVIGLNKDPSVSVVLLRPVSLLVIVRPRKAMYVHHHFTARGP
jgi:hypothetical protein